MADIAIIGGGAAGAALFGALLNLDDDATVHWVTGRSSGRGVAYGTRDEHHLLNVRAGGMGLYLDQEEDFVQHAVRGGAEVRQTDFLPRRVFGDFIEAQVRARMAVAEKRARRFALHTTEAVRIDPHVGGYEILLANNEVLRADAVVLAVGALSPRPLRTVSDHALASGAYELNPWNLSQRNRAPRRLIVIGTGLTAVDTLLSASTLWPDAELVAVSRHGQLPFVHSILPAQPYPQQSQLNAALLESHGVAPRLRAIRDALRESPDGDWRSVIDGMRPINATLWQGLNLPTKAGCRSMPRAYLAWMGPGHSMSPFAPGPIRSYPPCRPTWWCRQPDWIRPWPSPNMHFCRSLSTMAWPSPTRCNWAYRPIPTAAWSTLVAISSRGFTRSARCCAAICGNARPCLKSGARRMRWLRRWWQIVAPASKRAFLSAPEACLGDPGASLAHCTPP
jgi:hypothetical protein